MGKNPQRFQESFKDNPMDESFNMRSMDGSLPKVAQKGNFIDFDTI